MIGAIVTSFAWKSLSPASKKSKLVSTNRVFPYIKLFREEAYFKSFLVETTDGVPLKPWLTGIGSGYWA